MVCQIWTSHKVKMESHQNTSDAVKLLDERILKLGDYLADLMLEAKLLVYTFKNLRSGEVIKVDETSGRLQQHSVGDWWTSINAEDLTTSSAESPFYIGTRTANKERVVARLPRTLNAQFRWLLVSGFEEYERCLRDIYILAGYGDPNLWKCTDFGDCRLADISNWSLENFQKAFEIKDKLCPSKVPNILGQRFPKIQSSERKNSITGGDEITYKQYIQMISLIRNVITHEQSLISPEDFFDRLWKKEWKGKGLMPRTIKGMLFQAYFKEVEGEHEIWLVNQSTILEKSCNLLDTDLRNLLSRLASHACLVYGELVKNFEKNPFWERSDS